MNTKIMSIALSENKSQEIINLFKFFMSNIYTHTTNKVNLKAKAKVFFKSKNDKEKEKIKAELQALSFYDVNNYTIESALPEKDFFELMHSLSKFKEELLFGLNIPKDEIKFNPIERKISPSLEAYVYFGIPDIKPSNKEYGLLFE